MTIDVPVGTVTPEFLDYLDQNFAAVQTQFNLAGEVDAEFKGFALNAPTVTSIKALTSRPPILIADGSSWKWFLDDTTPDNSSGTAFGTVIEPTSGPAGRYKRVYDGRVNAVWFDAVDVADGTTALSNFLDAVMSTGRGGRIPYGTVSIGNISKTLTADLDIECYATIRNRLGAANAATTLAFDGDSRTYSLRWSGAGRFDGNDSGFTLVSVVQCDTVIFKQIESFGLLGNASSPSSAGNLSIFDCNNVTVDPGFIHDCPVGTAGAGSVPRAISLSNNTTATVRGGLLKTLNAGIITSGNQRVLLSDIDMETLTDNGFYLVEVVGDRYADGDVFITDCNIYGSEEGIVPSFGGKTYVKGGTIEGATNAAISMGSGSIGDCGPVVIDDVTIIGTGGVGTIVKLRSGSTACEGLEMRGCRITAEVAGGMMDLTTGSLGYFVFENNNVTWIHNSAYTPSTQIINWTTGDYYEFNNNTFTFEDASANIASTNWNLQLPLAVTAESALTKNRIVNRTTVAAALFRFNGNYQQLVAFDDLQAFASSQSLTAVNSAALTTAPPSFVWMTSIPTTGFHKAGTIGRNPNPTNGIWGWQCKVSGSPGTWTPLARGTVVAKTSDFTVGDSENVIINNKSGSTCTVTLPAAATWTGREILIQNYQAQTVVSASSNVVPLGGGSAGTAILSGTAGRWATLISNGTNWIIMAGVI